MAAHKEPASLRPRCTRGGTSNPVVAMPVDHVSPPAVCEKQSFRPPYETIKKIQYCYMIPSAAKYLISKFVITLQ
jgi:hypothetical protein